MRCTRSAFTLVELSIVLVILGLLVGGVLAGQSLIRSAELRNIGTEKDKLLTALNVFRDKYFAIPGDMPNAYAFWQSAGVAGCAADTTAADGGCNGDGNGYITHQGIPGESTEYLKVGMHLALAGLVEGNYTGMGSSRDETNTVNSRFSQGLWVFHGDNFGDAAGGPFPNYTFMITLAGRSSQGLPNLTHAEAWNVDTKLDDSKANTGKMRGDDDDGCYDQDTDGNAANGSEDFYGIVAVGADFAGDCSLNFIVR